MTKKLQYYHVTDLKALVTPGILVPNPEFSDKDFLPAYRWLEQQIGFYPLFMAVGDERAVAVTGYSNQWRVNIGTRFEAGRSVPTMRKKGEFPNWVLLSFNPEAISRQVFTDYQYWHIVLNDCMGKRVPDAQTVRILLKRARSLARWHNAAHRDPFATQVTVPSLDTRLAEEIWVRNEKTRKQLTLAGFQNVRIRRLPVS